MEEELRVPMSIIKNDLEESSKIKFLQIIK